MLQQLFQEVMQSVHRGTIIFLGLVCLLAFVANAILLGWLIVKKSSHGLARCPKCGRMIACPHCEEDEGE